MPKLASRVPSYRNHKASGQAVVTLSGKDYYLGPYGSNASKSEYDRLVGLWQAGGRAPLQKAKGELSVSELIVAYWPFVTSYYRKAGRETSQGPSATTSRSVLCHHIPISPLHSELKTRIPPRRPPWAKRSG